MVDWQSDEVLRICFDSLASVTTITLGFFLWYICTTFDQIELRLIMKSLKYSWWTHTPYLVGRYAYFMSALCFVVAMHWYASAPLNCEVIMVLVCIFGSLAVVAASFNMTTRLPAVWNGNKWIKWINAIVALASVVHFGLAVSLPMTTVDVYWDNDNRICQERRLSGQMNSAVFYCYTVFWDFVILFLTFVGLRTQQHAWTSPVGQKIRWQGLWYIAISVIVNIAMIYFALCDYNAVMDVILSIPGGAINVIVSCFMVTHFLPSDKENSSHSEPRTTQTDRKQVATTASTIIDLTDAYMTQLSNETQEAPMTEEAEGVSPSLAQSDSLYSLYTSEYASSSGLPRPLLPVVLRDSNSRYNASSWDRYNCP